MATFDYDAPPPPANSGRTTWRWNDQELRELAEALCKQGWAAVTADDKKDAKAIASSLGLALMRRRDIWAARSGEGLPRYLRARTADNDGKHYGYVVVDQYFVGPGDNGGPVRVYADGSRVMKRQSPTPR